MTVVCHHCKQEFAGNLHRCGKVTSQAFSKHIFHPANESCKDHCEKHKLMSATKGDWRKLRKCLTLDSVRPSKKQRGGVCPNNGHLPSYTHVDFHLTGTPNCPMGAHRNVSQPSSRSHKTNKRHLIDHGVLNQQTMFVGAILPVHRDNIEQTHLNRPHPATRKTSPRKRFPAHRTCPKDTN